MKSITIECDPSKVSDGYHTFEELYDHRHALFLFIVQSYPKNFYWVKDHYEGWDLISGDLGHGQISYHVPKSWRLYFEQLIPERKIEDHNYDGHTSINVLNRMRFKLDEMVQRTEKPLVSYGGLFNPKTMSYDMKLLTEIKK